MSFPILHPKQAEVADSRARFKVIRAGRKSGKTTFELEIMLYKSVAEIVELLLKKSLASKNRNVLYIAPTQIQARKIIWEALKARVGKAGDANEQRLEMRLKNADGGYSTIYVGGWENRENYRGMTNVVHIVFDELDTMKEFFIGWSEIFRPMLLDTGGTADFIGTPDKSNPNLMRLEKEFGDKGEDFASFHFPTSANPHIDPSEIEKAKRDMDSLTFQQEIEAEYVINQDALFAYEALVDIFSNAVIKRPNMRYMIVDVSDDGKDTTVFSHWDDMEEYEREEFTGLNTEMIIQYIRERARVRRIPMSHIAVDAIGVGAGVASSSLLDGIIGFKSSFSAMKTDINPVDLPNVKKRPDIKLSTDYSNLRCQCLFILADVVKKHEIASRVVGRQKEVIIEELSLYQDISKGDQKRKVTMKEDVKAVLGRSPDASDTWIMRMYFKIRERLTTDDTLERVQAAESLISQFRQTRNNQDKNSSK